jgi:hypothetical protein
MKNSGLPLNFLKIEKNFQKSAIFRIVGGVLNKPFLCFYVEKIVMLN